MNILVLGSGLMGTTAAYALAKCGYRVTVIERKPECAGETSFANGGQLSYSHAEPWASPYILSKLPRWLIDPAAPLAFRPRADLDMIRWGLQFLRNCTHSRAAANTITLLRLGLYSRQEFEILRAETNLDFDFSDKGILHIYGKDKDLEHAKRQVDFQEKYGANQKILSRSECLALEPSLAHSSRLIVGGVHSHEDQSGDAQRFTLALAKLAETRYGVKFAYGVTVNGLKTRDGQITAVDTSRGEMTADHYVMALGSYATPILRKIGIRVPIYPMKGYSITVNANEYCPNVSITDGQFKIVYSRLGNRLRIAGTAEFAGYDSSIQHGRITPIAVSAQTLFPKADWQQPAQHWACLRPSTPDGPPILGHSPYRNLFLNIGHGTLGWTQAAGSASIICQLMQGKVPPIFMQGLTLR